MLNRRIEAEITDWYNCEHNKALLIYGARQIGKTYAIRKTFSELGVDFFEFNLFEKRSVIDAIESSETVDDLIFNLSFYTDSPIPSEGVIFLDEIQECKDAVTRIKFWVDDGRYRFVMSGSLLGVELRNLRSAPVGYLRPLPMYPLTFEEFLQVFNVEESAISHLRECYKGEKPLPEAVHLKLTEYFRKYLLIGGMPAAVEVFRSTLNLNRVIAEHQAIIELYKQDFTKYEAENKKLILQELYERIPSEINEKNKRFTVQREKGDLRYEQVKDSFVWLWKAGVALPVFNTTEPLVSLKHNEKRSLFKLFLSDVGLLTSMYGMGTKRELISGESLLNKGAIYENVVAQELLAKGFPLYYYNNKKMGELDFVIEFEGRALPIEVKSGKDYARHSALTKVLETDNYQIDNAIVFAECNVKRVGKVLYLPLYMIMFLQEEPLPEVLL